MEEDQQLHGHLKGLLLVADKWSNQLGQREPAVSHDKQNERISVQEETMFDGEIQRLRKETPEEIVRTLCNLRDQYHRQDLKGIRVQI